MNRRVVASAVALRLVVLWTPAPRGNARADSASSTQTAEAKTAPNPADDSKDQLVLELPSNQWYEGPLERVSLSPDGRWALVHRTHSSTQNQLYSLRTG